MITLAETALTSEERLKAMEAVKIIFNEEARQKRERVDFYRLFGGLLFVLFAVASMGGVVLGFFHCSSRLTV